MFDWVDHLRLNASASTYLDQGSNSLRSVASHPVRVLRAELRLRNEVRNLSGSTSLVSRQASPFSNGNIERALLSVAEHGVYDFDDALMHSPLSTSERLWSKRKTWRRSVEAADVVIAGNDYLAAAAAEFNSNVVVIPSCVEPDQYVLKRNYELSDVPVAVWLGSPSTEHYLSGIAETLLTLHTSHGLRLKVISAGAASLGELDHMVDRVEWTADGYQNELAISDFGVMPLNDTAWTRGKCAYKLLQYGAAGLPMVGSRVGANRAVLEASDGFAVLSAGEWHDAIFALINESSERRTRRGAHGRAAIERDYSFAAWSPRWIQAMGLA